MFADWVPWRGKEHPRKYDKEGQRTLSDFSGKERLTLDCQQLDRNGP